MKKTMVLVFTLLFFLGFTSFTFAKENEHKSTKATKENMEIIIGKVVYVDVANKTITVTDNKTQKDRTFVMVSEKAIAEMRKISSGDDVRVKVKSGSNQAESVIKKVKSERKNKK